ncbi:FKBP-type peptidyl-prolyl cis-trans isomerase [Psychromonas algicola]|uniref:FKBP-type peptidyl-prolyl cis-trans isomerase n=1 Tax=Psychromonas algicola TaxID=2555642 RepID=UPI00106864E7|nr:FKBP-type peptidyl-prolyl cis-trans isomerase [Psychromonas sp. RZ5]TEW43613.1 FKBP-type peptidyl-prolyl cis-trans isomerase [Psychromonas sp. RZ5]
MIKQNFLAVIVTAATLLAGCNEKEAKQTAPIELDTMDKKLSYLFTFGNASQIQDLGVKFDVEVVRQAVNDANNGLESRLSEEEAQAVSRAFQRMKRESAAKAIKENNIKLGAEYLAENGKKEDVVTTESGLQYEIIVSGDGETPTLEDSVLAHYEGKLLDGKVFDSSIDRGEPAHFPLRGVIPGWTEVLQLMKTGDKWKVTIPYNLAYPDGTRGIDAGSTLIFEIELVKVIKGRKN